MTKWSPTATGDWYIVTRRVWLYGEESYERGVIWERGRSIKRCLKLASLFLFRLSLREFSESTTVDYTHNYTELIIESVHSLPVVTNEQQYRLRIRRSTSTIVATIVYEVDVTTYYIDAGLLQEHRRAYVSVKEIALLKYMGTLYFFSIRPVYWWSCSYISK